MMADKTMIPLGLLCWAAWCAVAPAAPAPRTLRVLTYNINALPSPIKRHKSARLERIAEILRQRRALGTQPDIVVLQEAFSKGCDMLIASSGYKYAVRGPGRKAGKSHGQAPWDVEGGRSYVRPASTQKFMGSGLVILSDFPIRKPVFTTFGANACAGLDCLANKAIVMSQITVPGMPEPVQLVTTHFNSNRSAKAPSAVRLRAHQKQTDILAKFLARTSSLKAPLIIAGDFNTSQSPRYQYFRGEINALDAAENCLTSGQDCVLGSGTSQAEILYQTDDKQFYRSGSATLLTPVYIERNFRETLGGKPLSDHTGYEVLYRLEAKGAAGPGG